MTEQDTTPSIHKSITVHCDVATAFRVWTESLNTWWPKDHTRSGDAHTTIVLEPQVGGRLFERTSQGIEHDWGEVTTWEPPHHFAYHWFLGSGPTQPTHVEIHFHHAGPNLTRIEVNHRGPELLGELWQRNSPRYDASWDVVLGAYAPFVNVK